MLNFLEWPEIGSGAERVCYRNPYDPSRCIKVSKKSKSKQTRRELNYYGYLSKRDVSYSHIPNFYNKVDEGDYLGLEMEFVCNPDGRSAPDLHKFLKRPLSNKDVIAIQAALAELKRYLIINNIVPCDLVLSNFLVLSQPEGLKVMMVDGLGSAELFPLANYIRFLGKKKIERKWQKFMVERINPTIEEYLNVCN
ncbi:YrbL family protein [Vibrio sp. 10N.261.52.C11]|uniref:YrbL family protein n=1 Tax=Vibrio TaxID=662 RepID=UPI001FB2534B|nr:YrbL family protein [Vibrio splendidus]UOE80949.1 hypothetical protein LTQ03_06080 [Vibrio splendidus]